MAAIVKAIIIGAAVGLAAYTLSLAVTGNFDQWNLLGAFKATFTGAISGAVTFGIGSLFSGAGGCITAAAQMIKETVGQVGFVMIQAGTHAVAQGILSAVQGESFINSAASGFFGSLGASAFGEVIKNGTATGRAVGTVILGALSGGIGSELTGGNFWQGVVIGGIVAGLNHAAHMEDGPGKGTKDWLGDGGDVVYNGDGYFDSNYIGPGPDTDPYELLKGGLKPLDMGDQAAFKHDVAGFKHDVAYYEANTGGVKGALLDKTIAYADSRLAADAKKVMIGYKKGQIDPITGQKISQRTYNMARLVYSAFKSIDYQKSVRININAKVNHFYNSIINQIPRAIR